MNPVILVAALASVFFALHLSEWLFTIGSPAIAIFSPANGFLLAVLMVGRREWRKPMVALAALAHLAGYLAQGLPLAPSLGYSLAGILEVLVALRLSRNIPGGARFLGDLRGVLHFFLRVILAAAGAGALAGGLTAAVFSGGGLLRPFATLFLADAAGLALLTPALLAWTQKEFAWPAERARLAELAACLALSACVAYIVFARPIDLWLATGNPMPYLTFPFMAWAAIRFGARGATGVVLLTYVIAAWYTTRGYGPFAAAIPAGGTLFLPVQIFPFAGMTCSLLPAVLFHAQKVAERDLRMRESRYRGLLSSTLIGVMVMDITGKILEANDAFLGLIKRSRADLEAGNITGPSMSTPEYMAGAAERKRIYLADGRMGPYDREWVLADGSRLHSLFFATRMEDGNALCMVLDIDELKRTQSELRAVETRFKKLFDSNIIGVAVADRTKVIVEANDPFLALTGYSRADMEAGELTGDALRNPEEVPDMAALEASIRAAGRLEPRETSYVRKDGSLVPVYRGMAQLDGSGNFLILALDISELKRTQAELERAMADARTASLAKSDFLAHMSHEIRTPMNGVLGTISLLQETRLDAEQQSYARTCRESGEHLLALINQVLDFSKIESGTLKLDHSEFSLGAMLEGALSPLLEKAQKKGLELVERVAPDLPGYFLGDSMRLQQILMNLIGNAVKFSDQGEVSVSVRLRERDGDRCRLEFEIADQGPGIAPETLGTLFRPFHQGEESLSRISSGTGLGLAISKELVGRMGGRIEVESSLGKGSRFRFDAWLEDSGRAADTSLRPDARDSGLTACVLESHPDHRDQLVDLLKQWGFRVWSAASLPEYLRWMAPGSGQRLDLAILSVSTQGGQSEGDARAIAAFRSSNIPVLCTLPFITQSQGTGIMGAGAAGILTKPFRSADVYQALRTVLPRWNGVPGQDTRAGEPGVRLPWAETPRVLVVDDHPINLTVASSMLAKLGCRVETAADGPEALAAASRKRFDLVFMDCQMPGMDGFEATRRLRDAGRSGPRLPIVALTAHAVKGFRERCLSEGMDDYISKPFTLEELDGVLKKWLPVPEPASPGETPSPEARSGAATEPGAWAGRESIDWERLDVLDDGTPEGGEMVRGLVQLFLETSRTGLEKIRLELGQGRMPEVARSLHKLKGACGTIGATAMFHLILDLESRLESDPEGDFPARLARLESEFARTHGILRADVS